MAKIYVAGIGPGSADNITPQAIKAIEDSDYIIGYSTYIYLITDLVQSLQEKQNCLHKDTSHKNKVIVSSPMKKEKERCIEALQMASQGYNVCVVSSGDCGIYGMAGIMFELASKIKADVDIEIIPGITAASAAAAILGAPLNHDFAAISLSDLLTSWDKIALRLECAAKADFVICLYNPKSVKRVKHIEMARDIIMKYRDAKTPVGIVKNAYRKGQRHIVACLANMLDYEIDMFTILIIGNCETYVHNGKMITPRGYKLGG